MWAKMHKNKYVEDGMSRAVLKSIKTLLRQVDNFLLFTWIGGKKSLPDQLVTYIIRHLKEKVKRTIFSTE